MPLEQGGVDAVAGAQPLRRGQCGQRGAHHGHVCISHSIYLSMYLSISLSTYLSTYLSIRVPGTHKSVSCDSRSRRRPLNNENRLNRHCCHIARWHLHQRVTSDKVHKKYSNVCTVSRSLYTAAPARVPDATARPFVLRLHEYLAPSPQQLIHLKTHVPHFALVLQQHLHLHHPITVSDCTSASASSMCHLPNCPNSPPSPRPRLLNPNHRRATMHPRPPVAPRPAHRHNPHFSPPLPLPPTLPSRT